MNSVIIVFNNFINGGCENLFLSIANRSPNIKFYLIILRNVIDEEKIKQLPNNIICIKAKSNKTLTRFLFFKKYVKQKLNTIPVIIDFHDILLSELFVLSFKKKKKVWHWMNCNPLMKLERKTSLIYYTLFKFYDKVIFICNTQKQVLQTIVKKFPERKSYISYNFVDKNLILTERTNNQKMNFEYIISIARIDYGAKDFETLIAAYENLEESIKEKYKLVIVGDGKDMNLLKERVNRSNDSNRIILTGNVNKPYGLLSNAKLFILSSYTEGFPITILESFVLGIPVISSNCLCGPKEILEGDKYGLLFDVGNVKQLAELVTYVLKNDSICKQYSLQGQKRANYYIEESKKSLEKLFI